MKAKTKMLNTLIVKFEYNKLAIQNLTKSILNQSKPHRQRTNKNCSRLNGYDELMKNNIVLVGNENSKFFITQTSGGKSGEGFIRINNGNKTIYKYNYQRKGSLRKSFYTPFKSKLGINLIQKFGALHG